MEVISLLQPVHSASDVRHAHTPTLSSSAAAEVVAVTGSPSDTPHPAFPMQQQQLQQPSPSPSSSSASSSSSSAIFLPQTLSELVLPPVSSSGSFQLSGAGGVLGADDTDAPMPDTPCELLVCLWDNCQQEFSSLHQLVTHLDRAHTLAMTQFVCHWEGCSRKLKPFDARYKLITHLRCHTGEKPYRCEVPSCKRSFSRLENLKLHTRTHTGEKPYQCDYAGCNKKFNNTSDRAKHKKTHIMRKPYACKYPGCGKSYTDPSSMRKHIKYTHKVKEESGAGISLRTLPKRKRNSASSSSSSSSTSSTPHTPQQVPLLLSTPKSLPDQPSLLQGVPISAQSPAAYGGRGLLSGAPVGPQASSKPQLIPMVKIAGRIQDTAATQQVLVPTYQQQQPVMMILTNSSPPATNWVPVASSPTLSTSQHQQQQLAYSTGTQDTSIPRSRAQLPEVQVHSHTPVVEHIPTPPSSITASIPASSSSSSTSTEAQLRMQIVHLQQQLYQSQLAAARASQQQQHQQQQQVVTSATTPSLTLLGAGDSLAETAVNTGPQAPEKLVPLPPGQLSRQDLLPPGPTISVDQSSAMLSGVKTVTLPPCSQLRVGEVGPVGVPATTGTGGGGGGGVEVGTAQPAVLPQYIPIPIIQSPEVTATTQYLYMSP